MNYTKRLGAGFVLTAAMLGTLGLNLINVSNSDNQTPRKDYSPARLEDIAKSRMPRLYGGGVNRDSMPGEYHGLSNDGSLLRRSNIYRNEIPQNPALGRYYDGVFTDIIDSAINDNNPNPAKVIQFIDSLADSVLFDRNSATPTEDLGKNPYHGELILPGSALGIHFDVTELSRGQMANYINIFPLNIGENENTPAINFSYWITPDGSFSINPSFEVLFDSRDRWQFNFDPSLALQYARDPSSFDSTKFFQPVGNLKLLGFEFRYYGNEMRISPVYNGYAGYIPPLIVPSQGYSNQLAAWMSIMKWINQNIPR